MMLLTYPAQGDVYAVANRIIRDVAHAANIDLLDLQERFKSRCQTPSCPGFFLPDLHPNREGYAVMAEEVMAGLSRHLGIGPRRGS